MQERKRLILWVLLGVATIVSTFTGLQTFSATACAKMQEWVWSAEPYRNFLAKSPGRGDVCDVLELNRPAFKWSGSTHLVSWHAGKDLVEPVLMHGGHAVLKVKILNLELDSIATCINGTDFTPSDFLTQWLTGNYGCGLPKTFLETFRDLDQEQLETTYRRFQQTEFVFLTLLPYTDFPSHHFSKLLGTCGDGYVVEQTVPVIDQRFIFNSVWEDVREVVGGFLDLVQALRASSLQICDVKLDNFSWDTISRSVKLIDLDTMFFEESLIDQFDGRTCSKDSDCHLFDCRGTCNLATETCHLAIADSNLARICRRILHPGFWESGLFAAAPFQQKAPLLALARRCGQSAMRDEDRFLREIAEQI